MKRVGLYARVSTRNNGQSPESQLLPLRDYAEARGFTATEYTDVGQSGAKDSRPALDRLMADARRRKLDAVIVWKFDRFARSTRHLIEALEEFNALGIDFISLSESIDTSTPLGKMVFVVIGAVGELERSLIRERVMAGLERARRRGKRLGRPCVEFDPGTIHRLKAEGLSLRAIGEQVGLSHTKVRHVLTNGGM